jgi:protein-tyrosine phosphatase
MKELFWVVSQQLAGRPGPDEVPWDIDNLRRAGIGAILSVNDGRDCDTSVLASFGLSYACFSLSDGVPPQPGDVEVCLRSLSGAYAFALSQMKAERAVLVHCSGGNDRTGLFLCYFLMHYNGLRWEEALSIVRNVRPTALRAQGWEEFAKKVIERSFLSKRVR